MSKIILTFDDGPNPEHTPRILDVLAKEKVPAVFFVLGEKVEAPGGLDLVRRAVAEGHTIGNHTFNHKRLTELTPEEVRTQILRTHNLIAEFKPTLFRPPYGAYNDRIKAIARELHYKTVLWNASFEDWRPENQPSKWVDIAMKQIAAQPLALCLAHDLRHTAEYLPNLLEEMKRFPNRKFVSYNGRKDFMWAVRGVSWKVRSCFKWASSNA